MTPRQWSFIEEELASLFGDIAQFEQLKNKSIFITGSSGFIGQWLVLAFNYLNYHFGFNISVVASSRRFPSPEFLGYLNKDKNIKFLELDVRSSFSIPMEPDYVIHLAGTPDRRVHASTPLEVIETIVSGTENIFKACIRLSKVTKILNFTSGHSLGRLMDSSEKPFYLSADCLNFSASYSESKRLSETLSHVYKNQYQLPISLVRPYSFIGALQSLERPWAINNFIRDALYRGKIKVLGNPNTLKSYLYPTDMVAWILQYLSDHTSEAPLELGSQSLISLGASAEAVANAVGLGVAVEFSDPAGIQSCQNFYPVSKDEHCEESFDFQQIINKTIDWFRLAAQ